MILDKKQSGLTTERSFINYNRGFLMTFNIICEPNGIFMGFDNLGGQGWQAVSKCEEKIHKNIHRLILTNVTFYG